VRDAMSLRDQECQATSGGAGTKSMPFRRSTMRVC
jgi:hypothetical protein